jgi:hypothetical protein
MKFWRGNSCDSASFQLRFCGLARVFVWRGSSVFLFPCEELKCKALPI